MDTDPPLLGVLGPLEVATADGSTAAVRGSKQRALLALLVLHRNRSVPASRLVAGLWGDDAPRGAEVTLRSHVSHLRRRLGEVVRGVSLTSGPSGYCLVVPVGGVDADRFEDGLGLAREALGLGRPHRAARLVREALRLWRGPPFPELEDVDPAVAEAARLEELRLGALEVLAAAELASGRHREVVADLEALVGEHPFRERFTAQLMVALYRSGRQAEALEAFAATRLRLADELGLDPGPELEELSHRVLRQDPLLLGDSGGVSPSTAAAPAVAQPAARPPDAVFAALARSALVGRTTELARLVAAWEGAGRGERRVVLVSGVAGIGKSHLAAHLARRVRDDGRPVLLGRCDTARVPYEPVAEALRSSADAEAVVAAAPPAVAAELAALLDGPQDTGPGPVREAPGDGSEVTLYAAVTSVVARLAAPGPVLLVVENAERIDRASSLLLRHLLAHLSPGVLLLVCFRDPPGGRHAALLPLLGDPAPGVLGDRVELGPLDERELADLVRPTAPDVDRHAHRLWQHTGGNPLYAKELAHAVMRSGDADGPPWRLPPGIRDVVRHRLSSLSDAAGDVLPLAAVLGASVDVELLAQVAHRPEEQVVQTLDEAVAEGLLVESGSSWQGAYAFPDDLVREALVSTLTGFRLRALHLRAAEALIARPGRSGSAAIAGHLRAAGPAADPAVAARYSLAASGEARSVHAWDEAVEQAEAAVRLLAGEPPGARAEAALTAGMLRLRSGRGYREGVDLLEAALEDFLRAGDDASAGVVHSRLGGAYSLHHSVMDVPRALEHFSVAERLMPSPEQAYHLHRGRAQAAMLGLRTDLLSRSAERAEAVATMLGRRDLTVLPQWALGWAAFDEGHLALAGRRWNAAWDVAHELADPYLGWTPVNAAALASNAYLLDPEGARSWCRRGLGQPRFTVFADPHATVVDQLALATAAMGDLEGAHEVAAGLPEDAVARRMLLYLDGRWEEAEAAWSAAAAADEARGDLHDAALNHVWLASARLVLDDRDGARVALDRALALACDGPQVPTELVTRAALARLDARTDPARAARHLARCDGILAGGERWCGAAGQVELARAAVAAAGDEPERADDAYALAVAVFARHRLPWHEAAALESWARLADRRRMPAEAGERRHRAGELHARIGSAERWRRAGAP
ncbi:hypothetical protein GCM10023168_30760 [Fodinibacter luteus]|uniref:OmpR/PhoB-type domain-containing protein n=1 Tax=Fodinibacter luteus TaxID=552064 RepID=A0ABP8KMA4_9MICO